MLILTSRGVVVHYATSLSASAPYTTKQQFTILESDVLGCSFMISQAGTVLACGWYCLRLG